MNRQEFTQALRHLALNPKDIIHFEEDLKQYSLTNQQQDLFYTKYWEVNRFIVACWDVAEKQGAFNHLDKGAK